MVTKWLGNVLAVGYLAAGIGGWIGDVADGDLAFWLAFLVGGGVLLLAGLYANVPRPIALLLAVVGALAGALALIWTIVVPLLAIAFAFLLVTRSRRNAATASA